PRPADYKSAALPTELHRPNCYSFQIDLKKQAFYCNNTLTVLFSDSYNQYLNVKADLFEKDCKCTTLIRITKHVM
ncbi:MAG: hypothetical protein WCI92_08770, partial [Bacteroidota bacterium]